MAETEAEIQRLLNTATVALQLGVSQEWVKWQESALLAHWVTQDGQTMWQQKGIQQLTLALCQEAFPGLEWHAEGKQFMGKTLPFRVVLTICPDAYQAVLCAETHDGFVVRIDGLQALAQDPSAALESLRLEWEEAVRAMSLGGEP